MVNLEDQSDNTVRYKSARAYLRTSDSGQEQLTGVAAAEFNN